MVNNSSKSDLWQTGDVYEAYVGRWSRLVAPVFLEWLGVPPESRWVDVGCGTGALSEMILAKEQPTSVLGIDQSQGFIGFARDRVRDPRATFRVGDAHALPAEHQSFDALVSGLVLNFVPEPVKAVSEFNRVLESGGTAGAYVWDYADKMEMMRYFWDAAIALDAGAIPLDEGRRCDICHPEPLEELVRAAGFREVEVRAIDVRTVFAGLDDYWSPFLGGQAPAPAYAMSLSEEHRDALRELIRHGLPFEADGSIHLIARAWAVKGKADRN